MTDLLANPPTCSPTPPVHFAIPNSIFMIPWMAAKLLHHIVKECITPSYCLFLNGNVVPVHVHIVVTSCGYHYTFVSPRPNQINWQLMVASCYRKTGNCKEHVHCSKQREYILLFGINLCITSKLHHLHRRRLSRVHAQYLVPIFPGAHAGRIDTLFVHVVS